MDGCRWVAERVHRVGLLCTLAQLASRSLWCDGAALQAHLACVAQTALAGALPASKDACTLAQLRTLFDWSARPHPPLPPSCACGAARGRVRRARAAGPALTGAVRRCTLLARPRGSAASLRPSGCGVQLPSRPPACARPHAPARSAGTDRAGEAVAGAASSRRRGAARRGTSRRCTSQHSSAPSASRSPRPLRRPPPSGPAPAACAPPLPPRSALRADRDSQGLADGFGRRASSPGRTSRPFACAPWSVPLHPTLFSRWAVAEF